MKLRKLKILFGNSVQCEKYGLENFLGFICTEKKHYICTESSTEQCFVAHIVQDCYNID